MLSQLAGLEIAVLIYFIIGFPLALYVCRRQGFGRDAGFFFLLMLPLVRIVGASLRIAADQQKSSSQGLYVGFSILNSLGLIPLLFALMGIIQRVNDSSAYKNITDKVFRLVKLVATVGIALAITAAVKSIPDKGQSSKDAINASSTFRKVSAVLLLLSVFVMVVVTLFLTVNLHRVWPGDKPLAVFGALATPFFLVRIIYTMLVAFDSSDPAFSNPLSPNIYVEAFMQYVMEFIIFALLIAAGLLADSIKNRRTDQSHPTDAAAAMAQTQRGTAHQRGYNEHSAQELGQIGGRY